MSNARSTAFALVLVGTAALGALPSVAEACSCMPTTLSQSWHESTDTFKVRVQSHRIRGNMHQYNVEVVRPFSGCTVAGDAVVVETNVSSAACGLPLDVGRTYLLTAYQDPTASDVFEIGLCGYNQEWSTVSQEDREFLASRLVVCDADPLGATCADGSQPVQCFANACQVQQGCAAAETCEFNTCGGCGAEYYDASWTPVCE